MLLLKSVLSDEKCLKQHFILVSLCDKKAQLLPYSWYLRDLKTKNAGIIKNSEMQVIHETIMQDL